MTPELDVAIVGSGFSGLCMGIKLAEEGKRSFAIFEKADRVGGTWRDNHYPGCACDIPSHLYSFSFEPNPRWSRKFSPQPEILAYLEGCVERYGLRPHVRLGHEVTRVELDPASLRWRLDFASGKHVMARHVVLGIGALSRPAYPDIPGLDEFRGHTFHSAAWDHAYAAEGKDVAVIGTGASAIQFVPELAPRVRRLDVYQRTPPWILPRLDRAFSPREMALFERVPGLARLYRWWIYASLEWRVMGFTIDHRIMRMVEYFGRKHIAQQIADPRLRDAVTPKYLPGCKRILLSDDYYPALARPNVALVTDAIERVTERGVLTRDGTLRAVDAIVLGTGFRVTDFLTPLVVIGRDGTDLNDAWRSDAEAYLGTSVTGFPNLSLLVGPNTGLGHNSMVFMIEAQVGHVMCTLHEVERRRARAIDVRPAVQASYNAALQPRLERSVWQSGCKSWYLATSGKNTTLWPGFSVEFWLRTLRLDPEAYVFE